MNDQTKSQGKKKGSTLKKFAFIIFIGVIILIAWLSVQLVSSAPTAFSSLASLAEGLKGPLGVGSDTSEGTTSESESSENTLSNLELTNDQSLVNAGEPTSVRWVKVDRSGIYTFSYTCTDGVAIDLITGDNFRSLSCDTAYDIGDTDSVELLVNSEKERYADVSYTVSFFGTNDTSPRTKGNSNFSVLNSSIQGPNNETSESAEDINENEDNATVETNTDEQATEETSTETEESYETALTPTVSNEEPVYYEEYVYTIPVSDPNGRTDLGVKYLGVGIISGNTFFPGSISRNEPGAIQFEVLNYGTKTSDAWTYLVSLPNGETYVSPSQVPLKPNEKAILSIGFPAVDELSHDFTVIIDEPTDYAHLNDTLSQTVIFTQ